MGIEKTFILDCDKCGRELADKYGTYTTGRGKWLVEKADEMGWRYIDNRGWCCAVCLTPTPPASREPGGKK